MSGSILELTDEQKETIRLLGVLALFHDIGKLTDGFVRQQARDKDGEYFDYKLVLNPFEVYRNRTDQPPKGWLGKYFKGAGDKDRRGPLEMPGARNLDGFLARHVLPVCWDGATDYNLRELLLLCAPRFIRADLSSLDRGSMAPARLVGVAHSVAHFAKEEANREDKQMKDATFSATPFGAESQLGSLDAVFNALPLAEPVSDMSAQEWRQWTSAMRRCLDAGLGDTRRPTNDVSLWDWAYVVAGLTRAGAAAMFASPPPHEHSTAEFMDIRFRTLRVNVNRLDAMARSDKISDLLGVHASIADSFDRSRELLESRYGFATRWYHDETGEYYFCPTFELESPLILEIRDCFPKDLQPQVALGPEVKITELRSLTQKAEQPDPRAYYEAMYGATSKLLSEPRRDAVDDASVSSHDFEAPWHGQWQESRSANNEICSVCRVRPTGIGEKNVNEPIEAWAQSDKAIGRNLCRVCLTRRGRRSSQWLAGDMRDTIWTDEVADDSGRLAMLVGRLGIDEWLNARMLRTTMSKATESERLPKLPSPARLYSIAEEARGFWRTMADTIIPGVVPDRPNRIHIAPDEIAAFDLGHGHAYEIACGGPDGQFVLNVAWDAKEKRFVTTENLIYAIRRAPHLATTDAFSPNDLAHRLSGLECTVTEPSSYLRAARPRGEFTAEQVLLSDHGYEPSINLMAEPSIAMILVPAVHAFRIANVVREEYMRRFGRVADRLPLHLGLVYFRRRTPLVAVMDAGRRFLDMPMDWEPWQVARSGYAARFTDGQRDIEHEYPATMGDGQTRDAWYPYLLTSDPAQNSDTAHDLACKHVEELQPHDTVWIRPSYFDYEYLDAVGRRFEIAYSHPGKRAFRFSRPYLIQDLPELESAWQTLQESLEKTQVMSLVHGIEATRALWFAGDVESSRTEATFEQFVTDTLAAAAWRDGWSGVAKESQEILIAAGVAGQLADFAELHLEIESKAEVPAR